MRRGSPIEKPPCCWLLEIDTPHARGQPNRSISSRSSSCESVTVMPGASRIIISIVLRA